MFWASVSPALCFLWLHSSWLSVFAVTADSWLVFNLIDSLISVSVSVRLFSWSHPRLHWSTKEHSFHSARFLRLAYSSSLWRYMWVKFLFGESTTLPCLVSSTDFSEDSFYVKIRLLMKILCDTGSSISLCGVLSCWCFPALSHQLLPSKFSSLACGHSVLTGHFSNPSVGNWISLNHWKLDSDFRYFCYIHQLDIWSVTKQNLLCVSKLV